MVASCLRGALPPVDLRAVCLVRAMLLPTSLPYTCRRDGGTGEERTGGGGAGPPRSAYAPAAPAPTGEQPPAPPEVPLPAAAKRRGEPLAPERATAYRLQPPTGEKKIKKKF